jgi:hypothetical protein
MLIAQPQQLLLSHRLTITPPGLLLRMIQPRRIDIPSIWVREADRISSLVLAPVDKDNRGRHDERKGSKAEIDGVPFYEAWRLGCGIDVRGDEAGGVADCEEEAHHLKGGRSQRLV